MAVDDRLAWWSGLNHQGMLISPAVLLEVFSNGGTSPSPWQYERLRDRYTAFVARTSQNGAERLTGAAIRDWLDAIFTGPLGYDRGRWIKQDLIPESLTAKTPAGERVRPDRVLLLEDGKPGILVRVDEAPRLGIGRSKAEYARLLALLRGTGAKLGLLTNGLQFRLCYAGLDHDAYSEWNAEAWFSGAETQAQLDGFLYLLGRDGTFPRDGMDFPLLSAVEISRTRQGELAQVLGEQVRQAVEILLNHLPGVLGQRVDLVDALNRDPATSRNVPEKDRLRALYQAATRLIMRLVVVLYAESRDLFPRDNVVYHQSYSVEHLYTTLMKARRQEGQALQERHGAWTQLLALFRLIHEGSAHPDLPTLAYGGHLFAGGDPTSRDPVRRAMALFDAPEYELDDLQVLDVLQKLKLGPVRIRQGRSWRTMRGPVDFSDLRTEYIGIMYQGLLDYELRRVGQEPVVFLGIGQEPVLPLPVLEGLSDPALKDLLQKLAKEQSGRSVGGEEEGEPEDPEEPAPTPSDGHEGEEEQEQVEEDAEATAPHQTLRQRALAWARRAVAVGALVRRPRGRGADLLYERRLEKTAQDLIKRVLGPGDLYLVRWGGTRKGSGTFYTRPQLAVPLTHRTLEPLCYEKQTGESRIPRTPEEILALKVVDPSMGSGSFLAAALNYLTDALVHSLHHHGRLRPSSERTAVLLLGGPATGRLEEEVIPCPQDDPQFDSKLRARLKRHIVERCIYGVDINPMAVELARLSLWIETMDRELPFEFLDHKLKVGNSLVGCWLHRFEDYPALAWARDGGDKQHEGVHHPKGKRTRRIKDIFEKKVKPELLEWVFSRSYHGLRGERARQSLQALRDRFTVLHNLHKHDVDREGFYYREIEGSPEYLDIRAAMDRWCSVWFWPAEGEVPPLTPSVFDEPTQKALALTENLRHRYRFFHWELEYPDVFIAGNAGFHAVLGNPPWDIQKPNSMEFFGQYDPIYRTYGKQEALREQRRVFQSLPLAELEWLDYQASFRSLSNWVARTGEPYEVSLGRGVQADELKEAWRRARDSRSAFLGTKVPFTHQGGADLNTYKLFLEQAHFLLKAGGRMGLLVPSGIYSDKGCGSLRRLFFDEGRWESLWAMVNERFVFSQVHHSFRIAGLIVEKGAPSENLQATFRVRIKDAPEADQVPNLILHEGDKTINLSRGWLESTTGPELAVPTFTSSKDKSMFESLFRRYRPLGEVLGELGQVLITNEFHQTNDSKLFRTRVELERSGLLSTEDDLRDPRVRARLLRSGLLPLVEGKSVSQFNSAHQDSTRYFVPLDSKRLRTWEQVVWRAVGRATDSRTVIASVYTAGCYNDKLWTVSGIPAPASFRLLALLNSFVFDWLVRIQLGATTVGLYVLSPLPVPSLLEPETVWSAVDRWVKGLQPGSNSSVERLRLRCMIDAAICWLYGLTSRDVASIVNIETFPALDKRLPEAHRQPSLTAGCYQYLDHVGIERFCLDEWHLPPEVLESERQDIDVWTPNGGWERAWAEARAMLNDQEWAMLTGQIPPVPPEEVAKAAPGKQGGKNGDSGQLRLDL